MNNYIFQCPDVPGIMKKASGSSDIPNDLNQFLDSFDPISKKFDCVLSGNPNDRFVRLPASSKAIAARYAQVQYFDNLTKSKYSSIADNLRLVYGDTYVTKKDVQSYHLTESKIIFEYLGIQNLDKLFDEDFFNFEWDIHTQQDFSSHKHGYQRDHFVHQIRNLWEMDVMLERYGFYEASKSVLMDKEVSPISRYVSIKCKQFLQDEQYEIAQLVNRLPAYRDPESNLFLQSEINRFLKSKPEYIKESNNVKISCLKNEYRESWFYKYVIFGASYLAALFHDLGYPVVHFLNLRQRLSEYSPASNMFIRNGMPSFDSLSGKLSDSLLFTIESGEQLRNSMEPKNGKYDHGVYSALAFLLHFYDSGLIYRLSPEKVCAIELAAIAIYSHNLPLFNCSEKDFKAEYYRPYFNQNPITFLLCTCDDLQEWDRRYFEITGGSDLLFCPKCHHPMMKRPYNAENKHRYGISEPSPKQYEYVCACNSFSGDDSNLWWSKWPARQEDFLKRKIFLIRACDFIRMEKVYKENKQSPYILKVHIEYDLYRLLELSRFSFAKFRIRDLNKLKKRLSGQNYRFQSGCVEAPEAIYLDYFLSSNPITIKVKILEKWLMKQLSKTVIEISDVLSIINDPSGIPSIINKTPSILSPLIITDSSGTSYTQFDFSLKAYLSLLKGALDYREKTRYGKSTLTNSLKDFLSKISNDTLEQYTAELIKDCYRQYKEEKNHSCIEYQAIYNSLTSDHSTYENLNKSGEKVEDIISKYCYSDTNFNTPADADSFDKNDEKGENKWLNYFEDLFVFWLMNEDTKK